MPFTPSAVEISVKTPTRRTPKAQATVWDETISKLIDDINTSRGEALIRWGGKDDDGENVKAEPLTPAVPSKNWRVKDADENDCADDTVACFVKIGSSLYDTFGAGKKHFYTEGSSVKDTMDELLAWVKGLDKDSADGAAIHALSREKKEVRAKKKYNPETDKFDL